MCVLRDRSVESAMEMLELAKSHKESIAAIGLDSDPIDNPPEKFDSFFQKAREIGWTIVGHACYLCPPDQIWHLLSNSKAKRIDHGINCLKDPKLVKHLKETRIPLTVCPVSDLKLGPYKSLVEHPIQEILSNGIVASVNSDDPAYLGGYVTDVLLMVVTALGWGEDQVITVVKNSIESAFVTDQERDRLNDLLNKAISDTKDQVKSG
eukprot:TRINITY_DN13190_c0_g1_i2.p1 TRINITY_DN13190_c0_g1~~TRINITY_DN13190_c0_g1_i2.p1  ORF type:complete len:208 (-),score=42.13 TRINITY_DN13190_c0_g1_i2:8-631(-)